MVPNLRSQWNPCVSYNGISLDFKGIWSRFQLWMDLSPSSDGVRRSALVQTNLVLYVLDGRTNLESRKRFRWKWNKKHYFFENILMKNCVQIFFCDQVCISSNPRNHLEHSQCPYDDSEATEAPTITRFLAKICQIHHSASVIKWACRKLVTGFRNLVQKKSTFCFSFFWWVLGPCSCAHLSVRIKLS